MEPVKTPSPPPAASSRAKSTTVIVKAIIVCLVLGQLIVYGKPLLTTLIGHSCFSSGSPVKHFSWQPTEAKDVLVWQPCANEGGITFECAQLAVPLDHFNGTTNKQISLALIRVPAKVPVTHPRYGGAILYNPGGPGGSGVDFLQRSYKRIASIIEADADKESTKFYDHISFDPRGIGSSTPQVQCFSSDLQTFAWDLRLMEEGILGSSNAAFGRLWSMTAALSGSCSLSVAQDSEDIKQFVSTASVAADMISIIEEHGRWREAEAKRLSVHGTITEHLAWKPGKEKINYWGFSYGTYLGMTFASMFPDRIERFIVDGVVDAVDYTKSLWADNLADTEREMQSFHRYCADAGYPRCALASKGRNTSSDEVEARVRNITNNLIHNPLPVLTPYAEVVTYSDVKNLIFAALYSPVPSFPLVANVLHDIERGNGSLLAALLQPYHQPPEAPATDPQPIRNGSKLAHDAMIAIGCGDGDSQSFLTREMFREHYRNMTTISPTIGPMWALYRGHCIHWTVRPLYRFVGPWTADTSFPMLFLGNSADPVTPVRNARKFSRRFQNAHIVELGSSGHCSLAARSACLESIVGRYFQQGELPEKQDTYCTADEVPFGADLPITVEAAAVLSDRVRRLQVTPLMPVF